MDSILGKEEKRGWEERMEQWKGGVEEDGGGGLLLLTFHLLRLSFPLSTSSFVGLNGLGIKGG